MTTPRSLPATDVQSEATQATRIVEIDPMADARWDLYVREHPRATANHLSAWARILATAYRVKPVYLALEAGSGAIAGVMPLAYANGLLSGPRLTSLPALRWAGPLASAPAGERALLAAACERVDRSKARKLAIVTMAGGYDRDVQGLGTKPAPPSWRLALPSDAEQYRRMVKKRSKGCFYDIKKARNSDLSVREASTQTDLRRFYGLYLRTMKHHRSLPRPFKKMSLAREMLGPDIVKLFLAERNGTAVAGLLCHFFNGMVEAMYNASDRRYLELRPNHAVYDRAITTAIEMGLDHFDFGSAWPGESLAVFKRHWATTQVERFGYEYPAGRETRAGARALSRAQAAAPKSGRLITWAWNGVPAGLTRMAGEVAWRYL